MRMPHCLTNHFHLVTESAVHVVPDYECMSQLAARCVLSALHRLSSKHGERPLRLVLSAGQTPIRTYELLATEYINEFDWSLVHLYQMDEYVDPGNVDQDFCRFLREHVVAPFGVGCASLLDRVEIGTGAGWQDAIGSHERGLADAGGIDLVVHGVGVNGHLGFNEPGSDRLGAGSVVSLSPSTRRSVQSGPPPTQGATLGLQVLLGARETILLASGAQKAGAVARALRGPVSNECPASWLRTTARSTVIVDWAAAGGLDT
jgi:6-phosphogluconolactonase/glucosamine-6-phosphate isomerase/deaminase